MKKILSFMLALCLLFGTALIFTSCSSDTKEPSYVEIKVEGYGSITVKLDPRYAPKTVKNFLSLVDARFYDGLTFHRIISGFMVQGGDPKGDGTGGAANKIEGEFAENGVRNPTAHRRGVISMARGGNDMNSASSQFFICHQDAFHLDGSYAAFGYVVEGMEVVDAIVAYVDENPHIFRDNNGGVYPAYQPRIESIRRVEYTAEK